MSKCLGKGAMLEMTCSSVGRYFIYHCFTKDVIISFISRLHKCTPQSFLELSYIKLDKDLNTIFATSATIDINKADLNWNMQSASLMLTLKFPYILKSINRH